jgi:hypothetical protein
MKDEFKLFCERIRLTDSQEEDAKTKYDGVCKKLHDSYYSDTYTGSTKLLFGSYKTKTGVRPLKDTQDVDVLFKIPEETFKKFDQYESNGQSALLQEIRNILNEKYTTVEGIYAWRKVLLVKFREGVHNVEVLPGYEQLDGTFLIPNTENGGKWERFDLRGQLNQFYDSNNATNGLTADLIRMLKKWVGNTPSLNYASFDLLCKVIDFLRSEFTSGAKFDDYHKVVKNFFDYLKFRCNSSQKSYVDTAYGRAVKAIEFMDDNKLIEASEEWIKIFGDEFPRVKENPEIKSEARVFYNPPSPWSR